MSHHRHKPKIAAPPIEPYICAYNIDGGGILYFKCEADNIDHAKEQLTNTQPNAYIFICLPYARCDQATQDKVQS
jgi:hypothetical protein